MGCYQSKQQAVNEAVAKVQDANAFHARCIMEERLKRAEHEVAHLTKQIMDIERERKVVAKQTLQLAFRAFVAEEQVKALTGSSSTAEEKPTNVIDLVEI